MELTAEKLSGIQVPDDSENIETRYSRYANDPVGFARDVLGVKLWAKQVEILRSVVENTRTVASGGYACGQEEAAFISALYWAYCNPESTVLICAPTVRQIKHIVFAMLKKMYRDAKLPGAFRAKSLQFLGRVILGVSSDQPANSFAGYHSNKALVIEYEADGILANHGDDLETVAAGQGSSYLRVGHPLSRTQGRLHDAAKAGWSLIHLDAEEHPNVVSGEILFPGQVTKAWVDDKRTRWADSPALWLTKVKGLCI